MANKPGPKGPQDTIIQGCCGNCACWRLIELGGVAEIGAKRRGACFAMPPVPVLIFDGKGREGQRNIRPATTEDSGCLAFFVPRPDLIPAANDDAKGGD